MNSDVDRVRAMTGTIATFLDHYRDTIDRYLAAFPEEVLAEFADMLAAALGDGGNTLYLFGNGGSHAIARHFEYALRHRLRGVRPVRVNCGADFHLGQYHATERGFVSIFESILDSEQVGALDLRVLISGSGDSDNLLHAARYCRAHAVRTISFAGFNGGKISGLGVE